MANSNGIRGEMNMKYTLIKNTNSIGLFFDIIIIITTMHRTH